MPTFHVTYDVVTPESAEHADSADAGFVSAQGDHVAVEDVDEDIELSLREALDLCHPSEDSGHWFRESDGRINYRTGEEETRSLHPPSTITGASYNRLRRLLKIR